MNGFTMSEISFPVLAALYAEKASKNAFEHTEDTDLLWFRLVSHLPSFRLSKYSTASEDSCFRNAEVVLPYREI
jgi:hypothetical protein